MPHLCAVDPAARRFAWATFSPEGVLTGTAYGSTPGDIRLPEEGEVLWVLERPQKYSSFSTAHKDLDRLERTLGRLRDLASSRGERVVEYTPHAWKGNVPKHIHHKRMLRNIDPEERRILPGAPSPGGGYPDDLYDAVALGLTYLDRIRRGGRCRKR